MYIKLMHIVFAFCRGYPESNCGRPNGNAAMIMSGFEGGGPEPETAPVFPAFCLETDDAVA